MLIPMPLEGETFAEFAHALAALHPSGILAAYLPHSASGLRKRENAGRKALQCRLCEP